jgi:hypothetical protein
MRLLVAVLAALVLAPSAPAAVHVVKNFSDVAGDSNSPGLPGSLRYILMKEAKAGDTITFASPSEVMAIGRIRVPQHLGRLVIDGAAGGGRAAIRFFGADRDAIALSIMANNVTVQNLVFNDASVDVGAPNVVVHPRGIMILNNLFMGARGALDVGDSVLATVQGNVFQGAALTALEGNLSRGAKFVGNQFAGSGRFALAAEPSFFPLIQGNTFVSGQAKLELNGGRVLNNVFTGGSLNLRTSVDRDRIRTVLVADNQITGGGPVGLATEGLATVRNNTFTGTGAVLLRCLPGGPRAPSLRFLGNTLVGGGGIASKCPGNGKVSIGDARVEGASGPGIAFLVGETDVRSSTLTGSGAGAAVARGTDVRILGGMIAANRGTGVLIHRGARPTVSRVVFGGNGGPGIDKAPAGISPRAAPGAPKLVYDEKKGKLRGKACPRCVVEIYESEEGAKTGNPNHGEGIRLLAVVKANGLGRFVFPARGEFDCPPSGLVTATATHKIAGTSEFSTDEPCSCVISQRFGVDPDDVPPTGFTNFGISVFFEPGTVVKAADLTDTATDLRPPPDALGPSLNWQELRNEPFSPGGAYDFFVNTGYNSGAPPATGPTQVWRYTVPYEPPDSAQGACRAILDFAYQPPPPE